MEIGPPEGYVVATHGYWHMTAAFDGSVFFSLFFIIAIYLKIIDMIFNLICVI